MESRHNKDRKKPDEMKFETLAEYKFHYVGDFCLNKFIHFHFYKKILIDVIRLCINYSVAYGRPHGKKY